MTFEKLFDPVTEDRLAAFERRLDIAFPEQYRAFLLRQNGGSPQPNEFFIPGAGRGALVDVLHGIGTELVPGDLEHELDGGDRDEDIPIGFIPIGHDPGGNTSLLGVATEQTGKVYYWDVERFFESSEGENIYLVGENFDLFLESLH
jgi:hypothetical protein